MESPPQTDFLQKQFPYRLLQKDPQYCEWISNTDDPFTEPFFDDSISRLRSAKENQHRFSCVAALEMLPRWAAGTAINRSPTAIIFHVSRCGSTLLSQLLALQPQHMVLSEVPFFDALLRLPFKDAAVTAKAAGNLFHAALQLYIHSSAQTPLHIFLKSDSWHLHFYDELRTLYPGVPFILLYRDPREVLQSQQRRRGMQSVPGIIEPAVFGFTPASSAMPDLDAYMTMVLETYFKKMIEISEKDKKSILVNYNEGAITAMQKIAAATHLQIDAAYLDAITRRAGYHGKYPGEVFREDCNTQPAAEYLESAMALYGQLEIIRSKGPATEHAQM